MAARAVAVLGAGRMGQALALALRDAGWRSRLFARDPRRVPGSPVEISGDIATAVAGAAVILVAVPDDAIASVAAALRGATPPMEAVVLHLSGARDRSALASLEGWAAGLGSFWPIQAIAASPGVAGRFAGAFVGLEGDTVALAAGERLAAALGMSAVRIPSEGKALAHAGAVVASNYLVTLLSVAEGLARASGVDPSIADRIYLPLVRTTLENVASLGTTDALTGPLARGDVGTVRLHLASLSGPARESYVALGLTTLALAERHGLSKEQAAELRRVLAG
ncbi:MAG: Rossmann-like and DUF2520 domain-containing protein [Gemmatimonadales bacterium]